MDENLNGGRIRSRGEVQRYTTTDGVVANAASIIGLGGPTAALTGAVTFESSGFTASVAKALAITKTAADLTIDSQTYSASGTVKASGPKDRVGAYEIGFLQTVYELSKELLLRAKTATRRDC